MQDIDALERAHVQRVRKSLAGLSVDGIWLERDALPPEDGTFAAGWWNAPAERGPLVVLPNPWDQRAAVAQMERICWELSERVLTRLTPILDDADGTARGAQYWQTVLGPWLVLVVSAVADRRLFLASARAVAPEAPVLMTGRLDTPETMSAAAHALRSSRSNAALMSRMASLMGLPAAAAPSGSVARPLEPTPTHGSAARIESVLRTPHIARHAALAGVRELLKRSRRRSVSIVGISGLDAREAALLARDVPGLRLPRTRQLVELGSQAPSAVRARLAPADGRVATLEDLVIALLPNLLPISVLEGVNELREMSRRTYGEPTPTVVCNYGLDEVQNEFLARCEAAGHRLAFAQHGGFYLQAAVNAQERLELRDGAEFWSWGRGRSGSVHVASPRVERLRATHEGGDIVTLIEGPHPPDTFVLRFASTPLGNQALDAPRRLETFVDAAPASARARMRLKTYPAVLGQGARPEALERLSRSAPRRASTAAAWMQRSRIVVVSYPDTPFLEALVIGVPTIGLWDPTFWEWRPELVDVAAALEKVGIIHADPVVAASHVSNVLGDPASWWNDREVVRARTAIVDELAARGDWRSGWAAGIRRLVEPVG